MKRLVLMLLVLSPGATLAAALGGDVSGIVKDALERPLAGVRVRLETADGQTAGQTSTDAEGRFTFSGLAPGTYAVIVEQPGFETATVVGNVSDAEGLTADVTLASRQPLDISVAAGRLEQPRLGSAQALGGSTYEITSQAIRNQPGGENNSLTQVLLQAPGVAQDSSSEGGIHVRNQMGNLQYRINGITLPEGATLFGQSGGLSPRLARSVVLLTGALPAEFGLKTTGLFDVLTKSGAFEPGGYVSMYGGSQGWLEPSFEYGGQRGRFNYFVAGDYLQNTIGISPATPGGAIHDDTRQGHGFGYFEYVLDASSKLSAVMGSFVGHFQIPNRPGGVASFTVDGISSFDSTEVNETQLEQNQFAVLAYRKKEADWSLQFATYFRNSSLTFHPDPLPDLLFNGIAQSVNRSSTATGLQVDATYALLPQHTLAMGMLFAAERTTVQATSSVLPAVDGVQTSDVPYNVFSSNFKTGFTYSLYLQDTWRVAPTLAVTAGLRFDGLASFTNEWALCPRLNAEWRATPTTTFHGGYSCYFTPPRQVFASESQIGKFANTTAAPEVTQNSPPRAERANYLDAGVTQQIVPGLQIGLDAYYKIARYQLDEGQFGAPVFLTPFNYQKAYTLGVELTVAYTAGNFSAYGNLAAGRQQAKGIATSQVLFSLDDLNYINAHYIVTDHSQLITASAGLAYLWRRTRFSIDLIAGSGLRRTVVHPNDSSNPPYQQVNLGITHGFTLAGFGKLEARFDIVNVLANNYILRNGTGVGVFATQFGPPRGFFAGLKKEF